MKKRRILLFIVNILIAILIFISISLPWWNGQTITYATLHDVLPFDIPGISSVLIAASSVLYAAATLVAVSALFGLKSMALVGSAAALAVAVLWFIQLGLVFDTSIVGAGIYAVIGAFALALMSLFIKKRKSHKGKE